MEQDVRVAGDTADIETGQLLIIQRCLCPIAFCNYKYVIVGVYLIVLSFTHLYVMKRLNAWMHVVAYFAILHLELVFFKLRVITRKSFLWVR
jgi:hypothetical protein